MPGFAEVRTDQVLTVVAAKDSGIKTAADLKGKRVAWVIGAPSLNQNIAAILAFANLTWDDVKRVGKKKKNTENPNERNSLELD